jgi:PKD repeat protein
MEDIQMMCYRNGNINHSILVFILALLAFSGTSNIIKAEVFEPPYNHCFCWGEAIGVGDERHSCNKYSGAIGTYADGFIGGGTAEAVQRLDFYVGTQKTLNVNAKILCVHSANVVGLGAFAGTEKVWVIDDWDNYHRADIDAWWGWDRFIGLIIDMVSTLVPGSYGNVKDAIDAIDLIMDLYSLYNALIDLYNAGDAEFININFSMDASPGYHSIWAGLRSNASGCITGSAFAVAAGQVVNFTITGIDPPGSPIVTGPTEGGINIDYQFTTVAVDPNEDRIRYKFEWGDGTTSDWTDYNSSGQPVSEWHTYTDPGTYEIVVHAEDKDKMSSVSNVYYVTINQPVFADFSGDPRADCKPSTVLFNDSSLWFPNSWYWEFGDGSTSPLQNPVHTYDQSGTYTVSLTASNAYSSDTRTKSDYITVYGDPIMNSISPQAKALCPGQSVQFSASAEGHGSLTYHWSKTCGAISGSGSTITYSAPNSEGTCEVKVYATDDCGTSNTLTATVNVQWQEPDTPGRPSANSPKPGKGCTGREYQFTTSSSDPCGGSVKLIFDWGDGSYDTTGCGESGESHLFESSGTHYVKAKAVACNSGGMESEWSSSLTFVVNEEGPPATPDLNCDDMLCYGELYSLTAVSTHPCGESVKYYINWGDGTGWENSEFESEGESVEFSHTYASFGTYQILVYAKDSDNIHSDTSTCQAVINPRPTTPTIIGSEKICPRLKTYEYCAYATDPDQNNLEYLFEWGDGDNSGWVGPYASGDTVCSNHSYNRRGNYTITAKVKNAFGCESQSQFTLRARWIYCFCPYVAVWDGYEFVTDNNILPQSIGHEPGYDVTDHYRLHKDLAPKDDKYVIRIEENGFEQTFADQFELAYIDHPEEYNIEVTEFGDIFSYKDLIAPIDVVDSNGHDFLEEAKHEDGNSFLTEKAGTYIVDFGNLQNCTRARILVNMETDGLDDIYQSHVPGTLEWISVSVRKEIVIFDNNENVQNKLACDTCLIDKSYSLRPRENGTIAIADVSDFLPEEEENFVLQLTFPAVHAVDFIGLDTCAQIPLEMKKLPLISASHNKYGDVTGKLKENDDIHTEIMSGEYIDLAFEYPGHESDLARDMVLISRGHYVTVEEPGNTSARTDQLPIVTELGCFPNPFNPVTEISFNLNQESHVELSVFNVLGQKVITLVDEYKPVGHYTITWHGRSAEERSVASGIYFYKLIAGDFVQTRKMMMLK